MEEKYISFFIFFFYECSFSLPLLSIIGINMIIMNTKGPIFIYNYLVTMCSNTCTLLHLIDKEKKEKLK